MRKMLVTVLTCLTALPASAAPLAFDFNAGPLFFAAVDDPFAPPVLLDFTPFEDIIVSVTIDDATIGASDGGSTITYTDPLGVISIKGASSGTMLTLTPGVEIEVENNNEFDVATPFIPGPKPALDFVLIQDTDFRTAEDFISDPTNLAQTIAEIMAVFPGGGPATLANLSDDSSAEIGYFDSFFGTAPGDPIEEDAIEVFDALAFGPVASDPLSVVPLPATLWMMLGAFGLLAYGRRKVS